MITVCKIFLISLLSFNLPVGRLRDIFFWRNNIIRNESVFRLRRSTISARTCFFRKAVKKYLQGFRNLIRERIIEQNRTLESSLSLKAQAQITSALKVRMIRLVIFNIHYPNDPYPVFILS